MNKLLYDYLYNERMPKNKEEMVIINDLISKIKSKEELIKLKQEYLKYLK